MTRAARLVVGALATWRVSHLLVVEDGPADLLVDLRRRADDSPLSGLLDCFACTSLWVGIGTGLVQADQDTTWPDRILTGLALSGAACLAQWTMLGSAVANELDEVQTGPDWMPEPIIESPLVTVHQP